MNATTCTRCARPAKDDAYVCDECLDEMAVALGDVPALVEELEVTLTGQRALPTEGGAPSAIKRLPINERASQSRIGLQQALTTWARFCWEEGVRSSDPHSETPSGDLVKLSRWLMWRVDGLAWHDLGGDAVSEIVRAVGKCWAVIDRPEEREYVGPCPCGRDLYRKPGAKVVVCRYCETETDADALNQQLRSQIAGRLVTAREGSTLLSRFGLSTAQKTIDKWHERKRLTEHGHLDGKRLYLFDDLVKLAAQEDARHAGTVKVDA